MVEDRFDGRTDLSSPSCLPTAIVFHVASFLTPNDVCAMSATCRKWREICCSDLQPLWREFVSKKFGRKYENYVTFTGDNDWRSLYVKISTFISNLRRGNAKSKYYPALLEPPLCDSYEGCLAMTTDCSRLLWENGTVLQCVDIEEGKELWRASVSKRKSGASRPSVVVGKSKVFLHLEQQVHVFELATGAFVSVLIIPPDTDASSSPAGCAETPGNNMPLDVSLRNLHFTFLTKRTLFVFHSENLKPLYKVQHRELTPLIDTVEGIDFCWAGNRCSGGPDGTQCHECSANGLMLRPQCQQICRHIVTWLVKRSRSIKIWDIRDGSNVYCLRGHDAPIQKVRHVMNWRDLAEYFLASLDTEGSVRIWGSHNTHFVCLQELKPDISRGTVFRMSFSTTHLMTMSKEAAGGDVMINIWKFDQTTANSLLRSVHRSDSANADTHASRENGMNNTNHYALPPSNPSLSVRSGSGLTETRKSRSLVETQDSKPRRTKIKETVGEEQLRERNYAFYRKRISSSCRDWGRHLTDGQQFGQSGGRETQSCLFACGKSKKTAHEEEPAHRSTPDPQSSQTALKGGTSWCSGGSGKEDRSVAVDTSALPSSLLSTGSVEKQETRKSLGAVLTSCLRHPLRGCSSSGQFAVDPDDPSPYVKMLYLHTRSRELSDCHSTWNPHCVSSTSHRSTPPSPSFPPPMEKTDAKGSSSESLIPLASARDLSPSEDDANCDCPFCNCGSSNRCLFRRRRRHGVGSPPSIERPESRIRIVHLRCPPAWPSVLASSQLDNPIPSSPPDLSFGGFSLLPPPLSERQNRREDSQRSAPPNFSVPTGQYNSCLSSPFTHFALAFPERHGANGGVGRMCSVLQKEASFSVGIQAYYADFIDGQLLALWYFNVPSDRRYTAFQYSLSEWRVYDCIGKDASCPFHTETENRHVDAFGEDIGTRTHFPSAVEHLSDPFHQRSSCRQPVYPSTRFAYANTTLPATMAVDGATSSMLAGVRQIRRHSGPPSFSMENRGDVWTLLDWKCVSLDPGGNVTVFDFCPKRTEPHCQPC